MLQVMTVGGATTYSCLACDNQKKVSTTNTSTESFRTYYGCVPDGPNASLSVPNCQITGKTECFLCLPNYTRTAENTCVIFTANKIANCQYSYRSSATSVVCQVCNDGFTLSQDRLSCIASATGCRGFNSSNVCVSCSGQLLVGPSNTCVAESSLNTRCPQFGAADTCAICEAGYYPDRSSPGVFCALKTTNIPNCNNYKSATLCNSCLTDYTLRSDGTACIKSVVDGCFRHSAPGKCAECNPGNYLTGNGEACSPIAGSALAVVANCLRYGTSCLTCNNGFMLQTSGSTVSCVRVQLQVSFCVKYAADGSCESC